ncbi:MAG: dual specificity protein phosphatase family protein, partial [Microcystaceae cyanobacterium]
MTDLTSTPQTVQPITENLWWVIPQKLAGVRKPEAQEIAELQTAGIGAIVSVFHDSSNLSLYEKENIPYLWLPIAIDDIPSKEQMKRFSDFVEKQNSIGYSIAVHCSTGRHRTGTILAAYLIQSGLSYEKAMQTLLSA